ncbi:MAG: hypothetical protein H0W42_03035 [Gemmatimonadaceae bacterium]|nr:hypothetical protein [Gemmatimonadaceae bacterium]
MPLTTTQLSTGISQDALDIAVVSTLGATANRPMKIDNEYMAVVEIVGSNLVKVRSRGDQGTQAVAHNALASVIFGTGEADEFPSHPVAASGKIAPHFPEHITLGISGIVPVRGDEFLTDYAIKKAGVYLGTLAAPNKAMNGQRLTFTSGTAFAHVITATGLFKTGAATVNTGTFAAFAGAGFTVEAQDGFWNVVASVGTTFA